MSDFIQGTCVAIKTSIFPILDGEKEEIVNEGMYGKAVCKYLKNELPSAGIAVPSFFAEDWGWWVSVKYDGFEIGLCIYSELNAQGEPIRYAILSSQTKRKSGWIWKTDNTKTVTVIMDAVEGIFRRDPGIESVERLDHIPW